jgi:2-amino-4-hydroxy-6-hydroxymethyldihydropteridine diphosphokinase
VPVATVPPQPRPRSAAVAAASRLVVEVPAADREKVDPRRQPTDMPRAERLARPEVLAYVGLGANLGDAPQAVRDAVAALAATPGVSLVQASSLYRSAPVDAAGPDYINAVACISTTLTAPALLRALQTIEDTAGRERPYRNAPRTLDLDLLLYGDALIASPQLTVPHPRMRERAFVLVPLREIAKDLVQEEILQGLSGQTVERCDPGP